MIFFKEIDYRKGCIALKKILTETRYTSNNLIIYHQMTMLPPDPIYIFKGEMLSVSCVTFKSNKHEQRIYAGTHSGNIHVWNLKSKREIGTFKAGDDTCLSVCIPQEGDLIITHIKSGVISFWNENDNQWVLKKQIKIDFFGFCKCQIFDNILYAPIKDSRCELISIKMMERLNTINLGCGGGGGGEEKDGNSGDLMTFKVFYISKSRFAIVGYEGLKLELWDLNGEKEISRLQLADCPMAVDYDAVSNKGLCGNPSDEILVFSLDKNLELKAERKISLKNPGVAAVRVRPDGKLVAVGCWDGKLRLYSWKSFVLLAALDIHSSTVEDVSFSEYFEEGSKVKYLLAAGSKDCRVSLWDLYN